MMVVLRSQEVHVVIADDDENDLLSIQDAFQDAEIEAEVHTVRDGKALIDYLEECCSRKKCGETVCPQLILLDLNMPGMSGYEVLKQIKEDDRLKKIPIVILTGSSHITDVRLSYQMGASSYITKPGSFKDLVEKVRNLCAFWLKSSSSA